MQLYLSNLTGKKAAKPAAKIVSDWDCCGLPKLAKRGVNIFVWRQKLAGRNRFEVPGVISPVFSERGD